MIWFTLYLMTVYSVWALDQEYTQLAFSGQYSNALWDKHLKYVPYIPILNIVLIRLILTDIKKFREKQT